jgi:hypothetical protein
MENPATTINSGEADQEIFFNITLMCFKKTVKQKIKCLFKQILPRPPFAKGRAGGLFDRQDILVLHYIFAEAGKPRLSVPAGRSALFRHAGVMRCQARREIH